MSPDQRHLDENYNSTIYWMADFGYCLISLQHRSFLELIISLDDAYTGIVSFHTLWLGQLLVSVWAGGVDVEIDSRQVWNLTVYILTTFICCCLKFLPLSHFFYMLLQFFTQYSASREWTVQLFQVRIHLFPESPYTLTKMPEAQFPHL